MEILRLIFLYERKLRTITGCVQQENENYCVFRRWRGRCLPYGLYAAMAR